MRKVPASTQIFEQLVDSHFLLRPLFRLSRRSRIRFALIVSAVSVPIVLACFCASWLDSTLFLAPRGRGLLEHPAFWALFLSYPAFAILLLELCRRMSIVIDKLCAPNAPASSCREQVLGMLTCRLPAFKVIFLSFVLFGAFALITNWQNTRAPLAIYGHDVWDSYNHSYGFFVAKVALAIAWCYIFPVAFYLGIVAGVSIFQIVNCIAARPDIDILPFEPDGCSGYRPLGQAMLTVLYLNIPPAAVVVGNIYAHRNFYATIIEATILVLVVAALEVFGPFLRLHHLLSIGKARRLSRLSELLALHQREVLPESKTDAADRLALPATLLSVLAIVELYKRTEKMRTWPYLPSDRLKWLTPLAPLALSFARQLLP
jgi:hypothetical protein